MGGQAASGRQQGRVELIEMVARRKMTSIESGMEREEQWQGAGKDHLFILRSSSNCTTNQERRRGDEEFIRSSNTKRLNVCNVNHSKSLKQRQRRAASKHQQMIIIIINNRDKREAPREEEEEEERTTLMLVCVASFNNTSAKVAVSSCSSLLLHLFCICCICCCCHNGNPIRPSVAPSSCVNYPTKRKGNQQQKQQSLFNRIITLMMEASDDCECYLTNNSSVNDDKERRVESKGHGPFAREPETEAELQTRQTIETARELSQFARKTQTPKGAAVLISEVIDEHCSCGTGRRLHQGPLSSDYVSCKMAEGEAPSGHRLRWGRRQLASKETPMRDINGERRNVRRANNDNIINGERRARRRRRRAREEKTLLGGQHGQVGGHRRPLGPAPGFLVCLLAATLITLTLNSVAEAVDCFKCSSRNGSNPACEDPFHNLNTTRVSSPVLPDPSPSVIYHTPCYAGKKGREGLFPASACIKLTGTFDTTGETLVVRHCALDSGTLTQDTELARMSHCGKFQFEGDLLKGCVLACPEDACNSARPSASSLIRSSTSPATFIVSPAMALILLRLLQLL